jgi:hypothetical protein
MDVVTPGGFSAVAATGAYSATWNRVIPVAAFLPLPVAVLVHAEHRPDAFPVGVGVPRFVDGAIHIDAVLGSHARSAWERVRRYEVGVSILAQAGSDYVDSDGVRVVSLATLAAVDLVLNPADSGARIKVTRQVLSPEQRDVQRRFDDWLDRQTAGVGQQFLYSAHCIGADAMDELADIVAPMCALLQSTGGHR